MESRIATLLRHASPALSAEDSLGDPSAKALLTGFPELGELIAARNGFLAFESALEVFADRPCAASWGVGEWNDSQLWRAMFEGRADKGVFFAQDLFGVQFCLDADGVSTFDPETAEYAFLADDLEGWADCIMTDYRVLTGHPLAHEWQLAHGPLPPKHRLVPIQPFFLGGQFAIQNLKLAKADVAMHIRAGLEQGFQDIPDGTKVRIRVSDSGRS